MAAAEATLLPYPSSPINNHIFDIILSSPTCNSSNSSSRTFIDQIRSSENLFPFLNDFEFDNMAHHEKQTKNITIRNNKNKQPSKLPTYSFAQDCRNSARIVHSQTVFSGILRDALRQSKLDLKQPVPEFLKEPFANGMLVPYVVRDDPVHGRGLYAMADIPKGTLVWDGAMASWTNARDFVAFLRYLPHNLQCDVLLWAYPEKDTTKKVILAMDEGSYMNDGGPDDAVCGMDGTTTTVREVKAGEHITENYAEFLDFEGTVEWFHEMREHVFGGGKYTKQGTPTTIHHKQQEQQEQPQLSNTANANGNAYMDYLHIDIDTTSTATGAAINYLFEELDALVEASQHSSSRQVSMVSIGVIACVAMILYFKRRISFFRSKDNIKKEGRSFSSSTFGGSKKNNLRIRRK